MMRGITLSDWQLNGVFEATPGRPFTGGLNAPGNTQTADQVAPVVKIGSPDQYYDRTSFAAVTTARYGNTGRNILRGPSLVNLDVSLFRTFRLSERFGLQFRGEAFNVRNTPHFNNPSSNQAAADFMRITSAMDDQRTLRFGLRLQF